MHKADWRARVCRGAGVLVLLAGVLFAAGLCVADTPHDSPVSGSMHSTLSDPAFWSRFQFGFTLALAHLPRPEAVLTYQQTVQNTLERSR
jgi:hypothetical protein